MPRKQPSLEKSARPSPESLAKLYESNGKLARFKADEESDETSGLSPEKSEGRTTGRSPRD